MNKDELPPRPQRGDIVELAVERLAHGGNGVARTDGGYVVFVHGAIPGDRVLARIGKRKRSYAEARIVQLIAASPDRIPPLADHPGAPWQVMPYELQLRHKVEHVDDALTRIGGLSGYDLQPIVAAAEQWRYRNKLEFTFGVADGDNGGPSGELICGFHAPGSWREVLAVKDCLLQSEAGNTARRNVLAWARSEGLTAADRRTGSGQLRHLVIREGLRTGEMQLRLVVTAGAQIDTDGLAAATAASSVIVTELDSRGETTRGGVSTVIAGSAKIAEEVCGLRFRLSPEAFFQTNTEMAERLYGLVATAADLKGWERLFDLYCGIGTIGLSLAGKAGEVWGLELVEEAIADAIESARENEIDSARFFAGDVRLALRELVASSGRPDVVVLDPPRAGLSRKVVRRVIEAGPRRIVYVSCNPTTLAPNVQQLTEAGYRLGVVTPVDMFPQTPHIEVVAVLER